MCIDFARGVLNHEDANSSEFDRATEYPVIDLMLDQRSITDMGGTMRLGLYPCELQPGSKAAAAYGVDRVEERHRHRFEPDGSAACQLEDDVEYALPLGPLGHEIVRLFRAWHQDVENFALARARDIFPWKTDAFCEDPTKADASG